MKNFRLAVLLVLVAASAAQAGTGAPPPASAARRGAEMLERATRAYRTAASLTDTARYVLRVPGAPEHSESQEFGFGPEAGAWICMPSLYVMQTSGARLFLVEEGRIDPHVEASLGSGLQAALDSAFGGQGAPLAPAPLALREARSLDDRLAAFRLRMLGPLRINGAHRRLSLAGGDIEVLELVADNGRVTARFDGKSGVLLGFDAAIVPAPGADSIRATARFSPRLGTPPPLLSAAVLARGRRVASLAALGGEPGAEAPRVLPADSLLASPLGGPVRVRDLVRSDGEYAVLEFWASWCAPCRGSLPQVARFETWAHDSASTMRVFYVNTEESFRDSADRAQRTTKFLLDAGVLGRSLIDERGSVHRAVGGGLPLTVVMAEDGRIVETFAGYHADLLERLKARARLVSRARVRPEPIPVSTRGPR